MTPPSFPHAGWCSVHGAYDKPLAKGECTCGADGKREAHNAAVEMCAELAASDPGNFEDPGNPSKLTKHEKVLCDAASALTAIAIEEAIRKLKVPDGE